MKKFKHSGTTGDIILSLPLVKYLGGGEFYLHLDQIDSICVRQWGVSAIPFHSGRMNQQDFDFMKDFMLAQEYITKFDVLDVQTTEITHNLDRFRDLFNQYQYNYIDVYSKTFKINDPVIQAQIRQTPWLTVPNTVILKDRNVIINRTERYLPAKLNSQWNTWKEQGLENESVFVGLPHEYELFRKSVNWDIPYVETKTMLELASIIAGCKYFIGNQSQCLTLAMGLGIPFYCELRPNPTGLKNEIVFEDLKTANYF